MWMVCPFVATRLAASASFAVGYSNWKPAMVPSTSTATNRSSRALLSIAAADANGAKEEIALFEVSTT